MALDVVALADSIYDKVLTVNGVDIHGFNKGQNSIDEFAEAFVPVFTEWVDTASILVPGTATYTNIQSGATVEVPGLSAPTFRTNIFSDEILISSLKQDLSNGISGGGVGAAAAKGWPIFSAAIATGLFTASRWTDGSLWITSDVVITGGNMYPFLFDLHSAGESAGLTSPGDALRQSADDHAAALYAGILSFGVSSLIGSKNIPSEVAVALDPPTLEFVSGAEIAPTLI